MTRIDNVKAMPNLMNTGSGEAYRLRLRDMRKSEQALGYLLWTMLAVVLVIACA